MAELQMLDVCSLSPEMNDEEFVAFKEDIRLRGQQVPIVLDSSGRVIDGRKRLRACQELGIEPKTVTINIGPNESPADVARSLNLMRTHYTPAQRAIYAARLVQRPQGGQPKGGHDHLPPTASDLARAVGVDRTTVLKARAILKKAHPEVVRAIEQGAITLRTAGQVVKMPRAKQAKEIATLKERPHKLRSEIKRLPTRLKPEQMSRTITELYAHAQTLKELYRAVSRDDDQAASWIRELKEVRAIIARVIHYLEGRRT